MPDDMQAPDPSQVMAGMGIPMPDVGQASAQMPQLAPGAILPAQASQPQPQTQPQQSATSPSPRPILLDLIRGLIHPQAQNLAAARPTSRVDVLENFLSNIIPALGAGFANEGHGPGAALRGAGAAMGAPYQQSVERFQMGQQAQQQQAQTQLTQAQAAAVPAEAQAKIAGMTASPRWDPTTKEFLGTMNDAGFANYLKGQGAASVTARSKQAIAELGTLANQGKVAIVKPAAGGGYAAYDKQGNLLKVLEGSIDPAQMQKVSTTQDFLPDGAGGWIVQPKTTVSGPVQPVSSLGQLQNKVPALGQSQTPQQQIQQKVPNLGAQSPLRRSGPGQIYGKGSIFAYDPQTNERVLTTPAEVAQKGYANPIPVKEGEIDKYRGSQVQFNDVQANLSRYVAAANRFAKEGQPSDGVGISLALNESKIGGGIHLGPAGIEIPGYSSLAEAADRVARSASYKSLTPAGKDLVDGYFRTMAAIPAYQKALTGIGKSNKEMLDLELANIPNPTMAPADILRKLSAFQENVDQGSAGIPRMPGIPTLQDTRRKFEGSSRNTSQPSANTQAPPFSAMQVLSDLGLTGGATQ
jgi:hypothetical protein